MRSASRVTSALLPVAAVLGLGCDPASSFTVRWSLLKQEADAAPIELSSTAQCSSVGISLVRVEAFPLGTAGRSDAEVIALAEYPCFPKEFQDSAGVIRGPKLPVGEYDIQISALSDESSTFKDVEPSLTTLTVVDPSNATALETVVVHAPHQCQDGIDNDQDGTVDQNDSACMHALATVEFDQINDVTIFRVTTSFLDANPGASCHGLGVTRIAAYVDGKQVQCVPCSSQLAPFSVAVPANAHELSIIGARAGENADETETLDCSVEITEEEVFPFVGGIVQAHVDFGLDRFLDPVSSPIYGPIQFANNDEGSLLRGCMPPLSLGGNLAIDTVRMRITDQAGEALDAETLGLVGAQANTDGSLTLDCFDYSLQTAALDWGSYNLEIEAMSGESVCFGAGFDTGEDVISLVPAVISPKTMVIPRLLDNGAAADGCFDCVSDADCYGCIDCCVDGICQAN